MDLPSVFCPTTVLQLSDEEIERIAAEPENQLGRRSELTALVDALEKALEDLSS